MSVKNLSLEANSQEFYDMLDTYVGYIAGAGKKVRAVTRQSRKEGFAALPEAQREKVFLQVRRELKIFEEVLSHGYKLVDSPQLLWRFLSEAGYSPCSDIFEKMKDDDVVVIYDQNHTHVFQNLNYFDYVSLSLEQIFCYSWFQYSRRPEWAMQGLYEIATEVFSGRINHTIAPQVPEHLVEEIDTEEMLKFMLKVKWISPISAHHQPAGAITVITATRMGAA